MASGVYLSSNGRDWLHAARGTVMALAVSDANQEHVLAASFGIARSSDGGRYRHSFWRSTDWGFGWREVPIG